MEPVVVGLPGRPHLSRGAEGFITHGVQVLRRVGPLIPAMHGASGEPGAAEVVRAGEQRRVDS